MFDALEPRVRFASGVPIPANYVLRETINVPSTGKVVTSHRTLKNGGTYVLRASGTWKITRVGELSDAEYGYVDKTKLDKAPKTGIDYGIDVDNPKARTQKAVNWGPFTATHTYTTDFTGKGDKIDLNLHDDQYKDNADNASNPLKVEVWSPPVPKQDLLIAFYGAGTGGFGNEWLSNIADAAGAAGNHTVMKYGSESKGAAEKAFLKKIDDDGDKEIEKDEIDAVTLRLLGYSLGGLSAPDFSRDFAKAGTVAGYKIDAPIPVEVLVTIDPENGSALPRRTSGPLSNVERFVNYYHDTTRRDSTVRLFDHITHAPAGYDNTYGNWFSEGLRGFALRSSAKDNDQIKVNTDWANVEADHFLNATLDGKLLGKDVNHDTMPWYSYSFAMQELK